MHDEEPVAPSLGASYRVLRRLGEGGMGTVWEAEDLRDGRRVAVKVLRPQLVAQKDFRRRFDREVRTLTALRDLPDVVALRGAGSTPEGVPFLVMELLTGDTVAARLEREGPFAPAEAVALTAAVLDALDAVHARGVVHRDIKPSNVLLVPGGVRLVDFGIALDLSGTHSLAAMGTPGYLAPEQLLGQATPATDVFAAARLMFAMITGHAPRSPVDRPSEHADVPDGLDAVYERATRADPAQRPPSASVLATMLRGLIQKTDAATSAPSTDATDPARARATPLGRRSIETAATQPDARALASMLPPPTERERPASRAPGRATRAVGPLAWAGLVVTLVTAGAAVVAWRDRSSRGGDDTGGDIAEARHGSPPRWLSSDAALAAWVGRWYDAAVTHAGARDLSSVYAARVRFRGHRGALLTPAQVRDEWGALLRGEPGAAFTVDLGQSTFEARALDPRERADDACLAMGGGAERVVVVRLAAVDVRPERGRRTEGAVPCDRLEGDYLLWLRRDADGALRVCHESWSVRQMICRSCPAARVCARQR